MENVANVANVVTTSRGTNRKKPPTESTARELKVLAILSEKGGPGKTTVAENLAVQAAAEGEEVVLLDIDPQANASKWGDRREPDEDRREEMNPKVISAQYSRLEATIRTAKRFGATLVVIDGPGHNSPAMKAAAEQADFVLVTTRPETNDVETLDLVRAAIELAGNPPSVVNFNQVPAQGDYDVEAGQVVKGVYGFEVCPVVLHTRRAFARAAAPGKTAREVEPGGKAAEEVRDLYKFVRKQLNKLTGKHNGR
jgi:chromosome partitioning protein